MNGELSVRNSVWGRGGGRSASFLQALSLNGSLCLGHLGFEVAILCQPSDSPGFVCSYCAGTGEKCDIRGYWSLVTVNLSQRLHQALYDGIWSEYAAKTHAFLD